MALEGAKYAEDHGYGDAYHNAVFAAQFQEQKNINDLTTLTEIAGQIGLDQEEFKQAIVSKRYEQAVLEDISESQRLGIQGVPYYIVDGRTAYGAQSYEALEKLLLGNGSKAGLSFLDQ
ncbi:2-hydroxychromene-2-carboxylate isomerase/DsbA-like thioredoxin domain [Desulfosporosinus sp. I2]|nr:2-hydroxychromene-2-carboxylate isomerase/DsbA-like thioredoxin domain [Desulfosporosinus sp. I2]